MYFTQILKNTKILIKLGCGRNSNGIAGYALYTIRQINLMTADDLSLLRSVEAIISTDLSLYFCFEYYFYYRRNNFFMDLQMLSLNTCVYIQRSHSSLFRPLYEEILTDKLIYFNQYIAKIIDLMHYLYDNFLKFA